MSTIYWKHIAHTILKNTTNDFFWNFTLDTWKLILNWPILQHYGSCRYLFLCVCYHLILIWRNFCQLLIDTFLNDYIIDFNIVRVECTPSDMLVGLSLANDFRGRIYATGNPQACFELGTGNPEMTLRIPLGTECGTVQQVM